MKNNSILLFSSLLSTAFILCLYSMALPYLNRDIDLEIKYSKLQKSHDSLYVENQLIQDKLEDIAMYALSLSDQPSDKKNQNKLQRESRVVQLRSPASVERVDISEVEFKKIQDLIKSEKYVECVVLCEKFILTYPASSRQVEAVYFLVESYFQLKEYKKSLDYTEQMMSLFPDHELTGFSLLRMGQVSQMRSRQDEAVEIFNVIKNNYSNAFLKNQASILSEKYIKR